MTGAVITTIAEAAGVGRHLRQLPLLARVFTLPIRWPRHPSPLCMCRRRWFNTVRLASPIFVLPVNSITRWFPLARCLGNSSVTEFKFRASPVRLVLQNGEQSRLVIQFEPYGFS